jgi:hypothetical protein
MGRWRTMIEAPAHCVEENYLIVQISYSLEKRSVKTIPTQMDDLFLRPLHRVTEWNETHL